MKKNEWPQTLTLGELLDMYAERMSLYANSSKACIELANDYRNRNREEVDEYSQLPPPKRGGSFTFSKKR